MDAVFFAGVAAKGPHSQLRGALAHFACSEVLDGDETERQEKQFKETQLRVRAMGLSPCLVHRANSGPLPRLARLSLCAHAGRAAGIPRRFATCSCRQRNPPESAVRRFLSEISAVELRGIGWQGFVESDEPIGRFLTSPFPFLNFSDRGHAFGRHGTKAYHCFPGGAVWDFHDLKP
jgi:hypothetical protein